MAWQGVPLPVTVVELGQVMLGSSVSVTITCMEQVLVLPAASVARKTTVLVPTGKADPLGRPLIRTEVPLVGAQLSVKGGAV